MEMTCHKVKDPRTGRTLRHKVVLEIGPNGRARVQENAKHVVERDLLDYMEEAMVLEARHAAEKRQPRKSVVAKSKPRNASGQFVKAAGTATIADRVAAILASNLSDARKRDLIIAL